MAAGQRPRAPRPDDRHVAGHRARRLHGAAQGPGVLRGRGQRERSRDDDLPVSMLTTDGADHTRLRAPGALLLGPAALASVAEAIAADADALLDRAVERGVPVDAVEELGAPLATAVLARLFGLPGPARDAGPAGPRRVRQPRSDGPAAHRPPGPRRDGRADPVPRRPRPAGRPGLPARPVAADTRLTRQEMLGVLGLTVVGGWQPLAEAIGNALYWLLPRPEVRAALRAGGQDVAEDGRGRTAAPRSADPLHRPRHRARGQKVGGSDNFNFGEYRTLLEADFALSKRVVNLNPYEDALILDPLNYAPKDIKGYPIAPFKKWASGGRTSWWVAFTKLKHDRLKHHQEATLKNTVYALAAGFVILTLTNEKDFKEGRVPREIYDLFFPKYWDWKGRISVSGLLWT